MTEKEALNRITSYCAASEHCLSEAYEKLKKWEVSEEVIDSILLLLQKENYIDEERYATCYIRDKYRFAKWGKRKIYQALRVKKVSSTIIQKALDEVDEEEYLAILRGVLEAKKKTIRAASDYEFKGKLIRFALGRGFDMEDIEHCISL